MANFFKRVEKKYIITKKQYISLKEFISFIVFWSLYALLTFKPTSVMWINLTSFACAILNKNNAVSNILKTNFIVNRII